MNNTVSSRWYSWLISALKEFIAESKKQFPYEVVDIKECKKTGSKKAVIRLAGRHVIEKEIENIITDDGLLIGLDPFAIRALTFLATVDRMKPDYSIAVQQLGENVDEYILKIKSRYKDELEEKTASEISKDSSLISKFSPLDANRIGYMAGVKDTADEFKVRKPDSQ